MNIKEKISNFDNQISIKKTKEYLPDASKTNFDFTEISQGKGEKEVLHLNVKNLSTRSSFLATTIKQSIEIHPPFLTNAISYTTKEIEFPDKLRK